eukprot:gene6609-8178_t
MSEIDNQEKLQLFLSLTGSDDTPLALNILEQNNWDVETSVNFFYTTKDINDAPISTHHNEPNRTSPPSSRNNTSSPTSSSGNNGIYNSDYIDEDEYIRAPIPEKMDTLVDYNPALDLAATKRRYQKPANAFEAFRDFQQERGGPNATSQFTGKQKTLAELFKPPFEILTFGPFDELKMKASDKQMWLLVNIQDSTEFDCQKLNRDTWSNKDLREYITKNFLFWQVGNETSEGKLFCQFYHVHKFPYIAVIDPRTGEKLTSDNPGFLEADDMLIYLETFCETHAFNSFVKKTPSTTTTTTSTGDAQKKQRKYESLEEEELERAIQASLNQNKKDNQEEDEDEPNEDAFDDYMAQQDKVEKQQKEDSKKLAAVEPPPQTVGLAGDCTIQIRCSDETLKGNFNSTDKIQNIYYFVQMKKGITDFKLLTSFPKVELTGDLVFKTLKEMDLAPRAVLMLQTN